MGPERGVIAVSGSFMYEIFSHSLSEFQYEAEYLKYVSRLRDKLLVSRSLTGRCTPRCIQFAVRELMGCRPETLRIMQTNANLLQ